MKPITMIGPLVGLLLLLANNALAFYNPQTGRWLSRDPITENGGHNLYGFALNDPPDKFDPDGRDTWCPYPYPGHYCSDPEPPPGGGSGYHDIPNWFDHPADEGKPCCCKPTAKLKRFERTDNPPTRTQLSMKMEVELEGCYKDLAEGWWTCWRPDGSGGWMAGFENQTSATLNVFGITFPGGIDYSTGPHITEAFIRYLSCEDGKWAKHIQRKGRTYVWHNGQWTW